MPEELKGKSGEAPATLARTDEALRLTVSGSPIMLLPRELVHVQWERESLFTGLLAAAGSTFLSALWLSKQEDRDLDTWVAAAMMASLGQAYLLGAWILRQTTLWLGTGKESHRLSFWRWRHRRVHELADWIVAQRTDLGLKTIQDAPTTLPQLLLRDVRALFADDATLRQEFRDNPLSRGGLSTYPLRRRRAAFWNLLWLVIVPTVFAPAFSGMMSSQPGYFIGGALVLWAFILQISAMASATLRPHFARWLDGDP